jgi:hypothetical protein
VTGRSDIGRWDLQRGQAQDEPAGLETKLSKFATEMGGAVLSALGYNNKADFVKKKLYVLRNYP